MDKVARKRAELALLELEAEFVAKKKAGEVTDEDKLALRAARQEFRENVRQPAAEGAQPDAIKSKAKVK